MHEPAESPHAEEDKQGAARHSPRPDVEREVREVVNKLEVLVQDAAPPEGRVHQGVVGFVEQQQTHSPHRPDARDALEPGAARVGEARDQHQHLHAQRKVRAQGERGGERRQEGQCVEEKPGPDEAKNRRWEEGPPRGPEGTHDREGRIRSRLASKSRLPERLAAGDDPPEGPCE